MPALTVFTPTWNRAHTLPRLYESLAAQQSRDFVWLVVDDGSSDDTRELVQAWRERAEFPIEYVHHENRGKHQAINTGVAHARTELFLILDSDDELLPDAVDTIVAGWRAIPESNRPRFAGLWTLCATPSGGTLTGPLARDVLDASLQELRYVYGIEEDMLRCFATEVLRRYPFPETPPGCPYIPEGYIWFRITREYLIRFLSVPCSRVHSQPNGLIANAREEYRLSRCAVYVHLQPLDSDLPWFGSQPLFFLMSAVQTARYGIFGRQLWRLLRTLSWPARILVLTALPAALVLLLKDGLSGRIARELRVGDAP